MHQHYLNSQISWTSFNDTLNDFNSNIFSLFQVDIHELLGNKFQVSIQEMTASTSDIDNWFYWEYEYYIKLLNDKNKDEKDEKEKQDGSQGDMMGKMGNYNPGKMMNQFSSSNFKSSIPRF